MAITLNCMVTHLLFGLCISCVHIRYFLQFQCGHLFGVNDAAFHHIANYVGSTESICRLETIKYAHDNIQTIEEQLKEYCTFYQWKSIDDFLQALADGKCRGDFAALWLMGKLYHIHVGVLLNSSYWCTTLP